MLTEGAEKPLTIHVPYPHASYHCHRCDPVTQETKMVETRMATMTAIMTNIIVLEESPAVGCSVHHYICWLAALPACRGLYIAWHAH